VYVIVKEVGGKQDAGVHMKVKPLVGMQEPLLVNLTV
jgi:hypothetical protein